MERELYDLSVAQHVLFFSQKYTLKKQVNTIATLLLQEEHIDLDILKNAVTLTYKRIDSLGIRLVKSGGKVKQYFNPEEVPVIEDLDLEGKSTEQGEEILQKLATKRVTYLKKPLSRVYLVKGFRGMKGIYFLVSHLVLDSWGICIFFKDVMEVYEALREGKELPKAPAPYKDLLISELQYESSPQFAKDDAFWKAEFTKANEPIYNSIKGYKVLEKQRQKAKNQSLRACNVVSFFSKAANEIKLIPKETVDSMKAYALEKRVPMQAFAMLAFRSYLSKVNKREGDVVFYSVVSRRGTLAEKNTGGTRVHFLPFRTILEESITFQEALEAIAIKQTSVYKHVNYNPLDYLKLWQGVYGIKPIYGYCTGSLTFQPFPLKGPRGTKIHTRWYGNGAASNTFYLTVMDDDGSGALRCYYEYQSNVVPEETISDFHSYMISMIDTGIKKPDITIGELLNIN